MSGGTLISFLAGMATSGQAATRVLRGTPTSDGSLEVSGADARTAARRLEAG